MSFCASLNTKQHKRIRVELAIQKKKNSEKCLMMKLPLLIKMGVAFIQPNFTVSESFSP